MPPNQVAGPVGVVVTRAVGPVPYGNGCEGTAVALCETVSRHPPIEVFAKEFGDSSTTFEVAWWTPLEIRQSGDEAIAAVKAGLLSFGPEYGIWAAIHDGAGNFVVLVYRSGETR